MTWLPQAWRILVSLNPLKLARAHVESELEKVESKREILELRRDKLDLEQKVRELQSTLTSRPADTRPQTAPHFSFYSKSPRRVVMEVEADLRRKAHLQ